MQSDHPKLLLHACSSPGGEPLSCSSCRRPVSVAPAVPLLDPAPVLVPARLRAILRYNVEAFMLQPAAEALAHGSYTSRYLLELGWAVEHMAVLGWEPGEHDNEDATIFVERDYLAVFATDLTTRAREVLTELDESPELYTDPLRERREAHLTLELAEVTRSALDIGHARAA